LTISIIYADGREGKGGTESGRDGGRRVPVDVRTVDVTEVRAGVSSDREEDER